MLTTDDTLADPQALEELEQQQRWADAIRLRIARAESSRDEDEVARLLHGAVEILERHAASITDADTLAQPLAEACADALARRPQATVALSLRRDLGALHERAGRVDDAITQLRRAHDEAADVETFDRLASLYRRTGRHRDLLDLFEHRLRGERDREARRQISYHRAELLAGPLGDASAAIAAYEDIVRDLGEQETEALDSLERLLEAEGRFRDLVDVLTRRADHRGVDPRATAELRFRVATILDQRLRERHRAVGLYRDVLAAVPTHEGAERALAALLGDPVARADAARILAPIYEVKEAWEPHLRALEVLQERATAPRDRFELLSRCGEVCERHLDDPARAFVALTGALREAPDSEPTLVALRRLGARTGRLPVLIGLLEQLATRATEPSLARRLRVTLAEIQETELDDEAAAIESYRAALAAHPGDLAILDRLIELYRSHGRLDDVITAFLLKAEALPDAVERRALLLEAARLGERDGDDVDHAIDAYGRMLELDPADATALERLTILFQRTKRWADLLPVLEQRAALETDPSSVIGYCGRIGDLWRRRLNDPHRAIDIYRVILDAEPGHEPTLEALDAMVSGGQEPATAAAVLERSYRRLERWSSLARVYDVQLAHAPDPDRRLGLLLALGEVCETRLGRASRAFALLGEALELAPADARIPAAIERLAAETGAWKEAARRLDDALAALPEGDGARLDLAMRAGRAYEAHLEDDARAIERYELVQRLDPGEPTTLAALDRLYTRTERWRELEGALERELEAAPPDAEVELRFRLGVLREQRLDDLDGALAQYAVVLAAAPEHAPTQRAVEALFSSGTRARTAGALLEPVYRAQGAQAPLLEVLEALVVHEEDGARPRTLLEMSELADGLGEPERAFGHALTALSLAPADGPSIEHLERLAGAVDGWARLARAYTDVVRGPGGGDVALGIRFGRALARVYEQELGDAERAEETYRGVLALDDGDGPSLVALDRLYAARGAYAGLADVIARRVALSSRPRERAALGARLGHLLADHLGRVDEAETAFRRVLDEVDPTHLDSMRALQAIHAQRRRWDALLAELERELGVRAGDEDRIAVLRRMATVAEESLVDPDRALGLLDRLLALRADDVDALEAVARLHADGERWAALAETLERLAAVVRSDERRYELHARLGRLHRERLDHPEDATAAWERALDVDPTRPEPLLAIAEIHRSMGRSAALADVLERQIAQGSTELSPAQRASVHVELAGLLAGELARPPDAVAAYREALALEPGDRRALEPLAGLLRELERWPDLAEALEQLIDALPFDEARVGPLHELATLRERRLSDRPGAAVAHQRILALAPLDEVSFEWLCAHHRAEGDLAALIEAHLVRALASPGMPDKLARLREVARIYDEELEQPELAYDLLVEAWFDDPSDAATERALERAAAATERWDELLGRAVPALDATQDPTIRRVLALSCGRWLAARGRDQDALRCLELVPEGDAAHVEALTITADLHRAAGRHRELAEALGRLADASPDRGARAMAYLELGRLTEQRLGAPQEAASLYELARRSDPDNLEALRALGRVHLDEGRWADLLDVLRQQVKALTAPADKADVYLQIASVHEGMGSVAKATQSFRKALAQDPTSAQALAGLDRLYAATRKYAEQRGVLEQRVELAGDMNEQVDLLERLAALQARHLRDPRGAVDSLSRALDLDPTRQDVLVALEALLRHERDWDGLIETYERHLSVLEEPAARAEIHKAMARLFTDERRDDDRAVDAWLDAMAIDDRDLDTLEALTAAFLRRGDHERALDVMEQRAGLLSDPTLRRDLTFEMARIEDGELGDRVAALERYEAVLAMDPGHLPSLRAIRQIHMDGGDYAAAAEALEREAAFETDERITATRLVELAALCRDALEDHGRAAMLLEVAVAADERNLGAGLELARVYLGADRPTDALSLLERLVELPEARRKERRHELAPLLTQAASAIEEPAAAAEWLRRAYTLDATHLPALRALAEAHQRAGQHDEAFKHYQLLFVRHSAEESGAARAELLYRMGVAKLALGEERKARGMFERALREDAAHERARAALE